MAQWHRYEGFIYYCLWPIHKVVKVASMQQVSGLLVNMTPYYYNDVPSSILLLALSLSYRSHTNQKSTSTVILTLILSNLNSDLLTSLWPRKIWACKLSHFWANIKKGTLVTLLTLSLSNLGSREELKWSHISNEKQGF